MSDDTTAQATPADAQATPDAPAATEETISLDEAKKLRSEARSLRERLKQAESKLTEHETATMTESQKLQRELESERKQREAMTNRVRQSVALAVASDASIVDRNAVADLLLLKAPDALDSDDPKEHQRALSELKKAYPGLFRASDAGSADAGATGASTPSTSFGINRLREAYSQTHDRTLKRR